MALDVRDPDNSDIHIYDLARDAARRLTFDAGFDQYPLWTPDGDGIVFSSNRDGSVGLYLRSADGTGQVEHLLAGEGFPVAYSFAPDGGLVFAEQRSETSNDIGILSMDGEHRTEWLLQTEVSESHPDVSPDGRWLAYTLRRVRNPRSVRQAVSERGWRNMAGVAGWRRVSAVGARQSGAVLPRERRHDDWGDERN